MRYEKRCKRNGYSFFDHTRFDKATHKSQVHSMQYDFVASKMKSNAMIISGPAIERHINEARKIASTPQSKILIMELNKNVFNTITDRVNKFNPDEKKNVRIMNGDACNYEAAIGQRLPYRFEDIDLCMNITSTKYIIMHRLHTQSRAVYSKPYTRCIMFTCCLRPNTVTESLKHVNDILAIIGAKINTEYKEKANMKLYKPEILEKGRMLDFRFTTYRDGATMISFIILYK